MKRRSSGFSLLEVLAVLVVFALLSLIATQSLFLTLRSARKTEATTKVKQEINYAVSVIERHLHNASSVTCPNPSPTLLNYRDTNGQAASFSCILGADAYIASASARITSAAITISTCQFICELGTGNAPPAVTLNLTAKDAENQGVEGASVSSTTKVFLRTY